MAFYNKKGSSNMTNSLDIVANSYSVIQPDGSLLPLTIGGTIAPVNNPTFTVTVAGVTADSPGLGQVNNTSDINKPVSNATQAATHHFTRRRRISARPLVELHSRRRRDLSLRPDLTR